MSSGVDITFAEYIQKLKRRTNERVALLAFYYSHEIWKTYKTTATILRSHIVESHVFVGSGKWNYTELIKKLAKKGLITKVNNGWKITESGKQKVRALGCEVVPAEVTDNNIDAGGSVKTFKDLLHPSISEKVYKQYTDGHYRDAVLNSIVAVFDLIRERTGLDLDGVELVGKVFSLEEPYLILSDVKTKSGQSDQKGFIQILSGAYTGIRNPKAHSLIHSLDEIKAAQYLIFSSLLARRVMESKKTKKEFKKSHEVFKPSLVSKAPKPITPVR